MHEGPVRDAFLHAPWIGDEPDGAVPRGDTVPWTNDPRLRRVMSTFRHPDAPGGTVPRKPLSEVLAAMDEAGVAGGILAAKVYYPTTPDRLDRLHAELAALSARSAGRLKWICTILPPEHGPGTYWDLMANPRRLETLAGTPGLVGVHITPSPWGIAPNDRWFYPLYAKCVDLELALFTYVGMPGPLWPMGPNDPSHLDEVALAFPDLVIVAHHIGDPWTEMAVRLAARHENYYVCTSAWAPKAYPRALVEFMGGQWHGTRGADKVLFASDYPLLDLSRTVASARKLALPPEDLGRVLNDTTERLFFS